MKNNKNKFLLILFLLALLGATIWVYKKISIKNSIIENLSNDVDTRETKIKTLIDVNNKEHVQFESVKMEKELLLVAYNKKLEYITKLLKIKPKNVNSVSEVVVNIHDTIEPQITVVDTAQRFFSIKDSSEYFQLYGNGYVDTNGYVNRLKISYNITDSIYITEFTKKRLLMSSRTTIDIHNTNPLVKTIGVSKIEIKQKPKRFGIGFQVGYGVSDNFKPSIYVGAGLQYSLLKF
jgi:hypothetical protein